MSFSPSPPIFPTEAWCGRKKKWQPWEVATFECVFDYGGLFFYT